MISILYFSTCKLTDCVHISTLKWVIKYQCQGTRETSKIGYEEPIQDHHVLDKQIWIKLNNQSRGFTKYDTHSKYLDIDNILNGKLRKSIATPCQGFIPQIHPIQ